MLDNPIAEAMRLLLQARRHLSSQQSSLTVLARQTYSFTTGALWMKTALEELRGNIIPVRNVHFELYGFAKYFTALFVSFFCIIAAYLFHLWAILLFIPFVFYLVEVQLLFLFPLLIDGIRSPIAASRMMTVQAGGTISAIISVVVIAREMLFGGFLKRGFSSSWCCGCLAVILWYEELRVQKMSFR